MWDDSFEILFLAGFVAGCAIRARYTMGQKRSCGGVGRELPLMLLVGVAMQIVPLIYIFSSWLDFADYRLPGRADALEGLVGVAVFGAALWLLWRAHADLGRQWSVKAEIQDDHELVTTGVFGRIRHPMYAAHWLWAVAQALLLHNWIAGPAMLAAFLPLYAVRVPREEQVMLDHFGDRYRAYMARTGRMIPRLPR